MPIVRLNEKGEKIPDEVEVFVREMIEKSETKDTVRKEEKAKKLRLGSYVVAAGSVAALALYQFSSVDLGLLVAILSSSVASTLNLWAD